MSSLNNNNSSRNIFTVKQFVDANPWITVGGIRAQLFQRKINGMELAGVILKSGRKLLIDADCYLLWLKSQSKLNPK